MEDPGMLRCPSCGHGNRADRRFCTECGSRLGRTCATCGTAVEPNEKFCGSCGAPLIAGLARDPDQAEVRKVVTIVFADLIGSMSLHERLDAESTRRLMENYYQALRAAVEAHGGTVVKLLGDGVMAAFGVPHVAEDDAIRAVRAAVAMQQAFQVLSDERAAAARPLGLRIGVNTGEVVVSADKTDIVGDPANVAARLQQEAQDAEVLIGESTRRLVGELVTLAPAGVFSLKGRAETVTAYRVVSLERPAGAAATAFVGRDDELRRITAVYDAAGAERRARLAVVLGSPGLGKSRLLDEIGRRCGDAATVVSVRCDATGGATFAPIARALRAVLRCDDASSDEALRAAIEAALPGTDADRSRIAGGIAALLAGTPAPPEETFFVVRRFLAALAATQPVVLAIDDLHWAEPLLLDLVEHLVQWGTGMPLLVLAAARPELRDLRSSLARTGGLVSDVVTLAGLDSLAATRLAANVIGAEVLPAAVAGRVLATSEGNPLFVGELVRMLVADGALKKDGERWTTAVDLTALDMPPTIQALLAARIERLRSEERTVLERAAVVGRQFSRAAVAHLLPREITDLDSRLEALRRSELIESDATWFLGEPALRFHHGLTRDAAYRRILKGTRAELHGRCADWIESRVRQGETAVAHHETVGWHLEQAHQYLRELGPIDEHGRAVGERAARYLGAAGKRALARDDAAVAADLLGRALRVLDAADSACADLALDRCEALLSAGDVAHASGAIDELGRLIGTDRPSPASLQSPPSSSRLRAWHTCFAGQLAVLTDPQTLRATVDALAAAAAELASVGDAAGEAKAHQVHAQALQRLGAIGACEAALDKALAAARRAADRRRANAVLAGAPQAALWGPSPVTRASGRCLDVVRVLRITQGAPAVEAVALRCEAVLEALRGRTDAARRMISSSRRMVEELGITQQVLETDLYTGSIELLEEDVAAAECSLRAAYEGFRTHGLGIDAARAAAQLSRAVFAQGKVAEAEALSHESEALAGDDLQAAIAWRRVRAEALAARGEHVAAVDVARTAVDIAGATDSLLLHANARMGLAAALRAAGRSAEAAAEEGRAIELWEAKGATLLVERARRDAPRVAADVVRRAREAPAPAKAWGGHPGGAAEWIPAAAGMTTGGKLAQGGTPRVRPNAATAHMARHDTTMAARDADALPGLFADGFECVDHINRIELGREQMLAIYRSNLGAQNLTYSNEPLATLGNSLALLRWSMSASGVTRGKFDVGAYELEGIALIEVDANGRQRRAEFFALDRLGDAIARLYERHADLLPDGPERIRAAATARSAASMLKPPDLDRLATAFAPTIEMVDHRTLGTWSAHGAGAALQHFRSLLDVADGIALQEYDVLDLRSDALLVRRTHCGSERVSGGAYERYLLRLWVFGGDGRVTHLEYFDADRDAEALARFDELAAEPVAPSRAAPMIERRVRANAATTYAARINAAVAARDDGAFASLMAENLEVVDHTVGRVYGREELIATFQWVFKAADLSFVMEPLATQGDALALIRVSLSASGVTDGTFDVGAHQTDRMAVFEVDVQGRGVRGEVFAADRLGDAIIRLYERYAELLPDGPECERAVATARTAAVITQRLDAGSLSAFAADFTMVDHRPLGLGRALAALRPAESAAPASERFAHAIAELDKLTESRVVRADDILALRPDMLLVRHTALGIDRSSGGSYEHSFIRLCVFNRNGLVSRYELFDADRDAEALARFDVLTGAHPTPSQTAPRSRRRVRPNAATAHAARTDAALAARDADALANLLADGCEVVDHINRVEWDRERMLATWRSELKAQDLTYRTEPLATLGDSVALCHWSLSARGVAGRKFDVGAYEIECIILIEVDGRGRRTHSEAFASDELGAAIARLYERYAELLPEGPECARAAATARSVAAFFGPRDLDRYATAIGPDVELVHHRGLVGHGWSRGRDAWLRVFRVIFETADETTSVEDILALTPEACLVRWKTSGTDRATSGAEERTFLMLAVFGPDGLMSRNEWFALGHEAEALARFDELTAAPSSAGSTAALRRTGEKSVRRVRPNAATASEALIEAAIASRDLDAIAAHIAEDSEVVDHRMHISYDRQGSLVTLRGLIRSPDAAYRSEPLASLGDSLALCHYRMSASGAAGKKFDVGDFGAYEIENIILVEVDEQGRRRRCEVFAVDHLSDAVARLYERYAELLPAGPERERAAATARSVAARVGRFDLDRYATLLAPAVEVIDHRILGTWSARGAEEYLRHWRSLLDVASDVALRDDDVLALKPDAFLVRHTHVGSERAGGGTYERHCLGLRVVGADGLVTRVEYFDADRDAEALARFDELTAELPLAGATDRIERRVRPNAATANAARTDAAIAARDADALPMLLADRYDFVDHFNKVEYGREEVLRQWRSTFRAQDLTYRDESLATLGDSLALCRLSVSASGVAGGKFDVGAYETDNSVLIEVDSSGRRRRGEMFASDRLSDAIVRLYERYAELLPNGPEHDRAAVTARSVAVILAPPDDLDRYRTAIAPTIECFDHRLVGTGYARGVEPFLHRIRVMRETAANMDMRSDDILDLRSDAFLLHRITSGTDRTSGGTYERHLLALEVFGADGLVVRSERFDADREADALARFDELTGKDRVRHSPVSARGTARMDKGVAALIENAATRSVERVMGALDAQDWDRIAVEFAPEFRGSDRRKIVGLPELDRDQQLKAFRFDRDIYGVRITCRTLATRGDRLALFRIATDRTGGDIGKSEAEWLNVIQVNEHGQRVAGIAFDPDDLDAAYAELDARYAAGEGAPYAELLATATAAAQAVAAGDRDAFVGLLPDDFKLVVHRRFASTGAPLGRGDFFAFVNAAPADVAVRSRVRIDHVLRLSATAGVSVATMHGTVGGGDFETSFVNVMTHDGRRPHTMETFDLDQIDAALARFDELTGDAQPYIAAGRAEESVAARFANPAWRAVVASADAMQRGDWDGLVALFAPTHVFDDRRPLLRTTVEGEAYFANLRIIFNTTKALSQRLLATRGDRLALYHATGTGGSRDGGPAEFEMLCVNEVDGAGRRIALVTFDPDALDAAYAELDARYAAGEGARYAEQLTGLTAFRRAWAARDWDVMATYFASGFVLFDHRPLGWPTMDAAMYIESVRALVAEAPDVRLRMDHIRLCERGSLRAHLMLGTREGGRFEVPRVIVSEVDAKGRSVRHDSYGTDQLDAALARYAELSATSIDGLRASGQSPPRVANAATRAAEQFWDAWRALDIERVATLLAPRFRNLDRRQIVGTDLDRDQFLDSFWYVFGRASSLRATGELLATRGERLALFRMCVASTEVSSGPSEFAFLQIWEVDDLGHIAAGFGFDPDDLDAAYAELDARHAAGERARYGRVSEWMRAFGRAIASHDWDAARALFSADLVVRDHRPLGWETLHGSAVYVESLKSLVDLAPDVRLRVDHMSLSDSAAFLVDAWVGTREGGAFEAPRAVVLEFDKDGRIRSLDFYNPEQIDEARARFAEFGNPAESPVAQGRTGEGAVRDPLRIPPNAATRAADRFWEIRTGEDWEALTALCSPSLVYEDRRRMNLFSGGRDMLIASARWTRSQGVQGTSTLLATAGDRLALWHIHGRSARDWPNFEIDFLTLHEVDAEGRLAAWINFDLDDRRAASAEMHERFARSDAARSIPAAWFELTRVISRDLKRVRAALPDGFIFHDHRRTGLGRIEGADNYIASLAAVLEQAPDVIFEPLYLVATGKYGSVWMCHRFGNFAEALGGGEFETVLAVLARYDGERLVALELFEPEDLHVAKARFAELRPDPLRIAPNAASRTLDRLSQAVETKSWPGCRAVASPGFTYEDRRRYALVTGDVEGWIKSMEEATSWPGLRLWQTLIGTAGDRIVLHRVLWTRQPEEGAFEIEAIRLIEVDADGRLAAWINFDIEDRAEAFAEALARFAAGEAASVGGQALNAAFHRALNQHDWEAVRCCLAPDFVLTDRRELSVLGTLSRDEWIDSLRALADLAADVNSEVICIFDWNRHGRANAIRLFGTQEGGLFENVFIGVWLTDSDRIQRYEIFDVADADRALARFEELCAEMAGRGR
jgi:class 3 adenylate cyclase/tetratricopeptide (TPR) repeat protein